MYYLGEAHRLLSHFSKAAINWYLQAAEAGDVYAMLRLYQAGACPPGGYCPEGFSNWDYKAYAQKLPEAEAGNILAMEDLFFIGAGSWWLKRAAEQDNARAQLQLGLLIADGRYPGWPYYRYWSEAARLKAALAWYRRAAELGYAPAMVHLSNALYQQGLDDESWYWDKEAAHLGHIDRTSLVGSCLLNPNYSRSIRCPAQQDVVKGCGILLMMQRELSAQYMEPRLSRHLEIINAMTDEERAAAEAFSIEWYNGLGAPLSQYPSRFGL